MISFIRRWICHIDWKWYELRRGIRNICRYAPVVWHDEDFDWSGLATVMEYKFRMMAIAQETGHCMCGTEYAKECRTCAEHLKRLVADDIGEPGTAQFKFYGERMKGHEREIGRRIGRHLRHWWC